MRVHDAGAELVVAIPNTLCLAPTVCAVLLSLIAAGCSHGFLRFAGLSVAELTRLGAVEASYNVSARDVRVARMRTCLARKTIMVVQRAHFKTGN